jgi:hypothetical protein
MSLFLMSLPFLYILKRLLLLTVLPLNYFMVPPLPLHPPTSVVAGQTSSAPAHLQGCSLVMMGDPSVVTGAKLVLHKTIFSSYASLLVTLFPIFDMCLGDLAIIWF